MSRFFHVHEIRRPEDVQPHLAKPYHRREGYSAHALATSWVQAGGIPAPVRAVLDCCDDYREAELIEGFFEREVDLRTRGRPSQTDLLAFVVARGGYAVIAVEGKVEEPFSSPVAKWNNASPTKEARLSALCRTLGLAAGGVAAIRYQLLHRSASAVYEAQRYRCEKAMMLVHTFSPAQSSFADFAAFTAAVGVPVLAPGHVSAEKVCEGVKLRFAWCADRSA